MKSFRQFYDTKKITEQSDISFEIASDDSDFYLEILLDSEKVHDEQHINMSFMGEHIGSIILEWEKQFPEYVRTADVNIAEHMTRSGFGLDLYKFCLRYVQDRGFNGLYSDKKHRNKNSNRFWDKYKTRTDSKTGYDLME